MKKGIVIYLNGVTSSGKTTIAKNFILAENKPYLYLGLDTFINMLPLGYFGQVHPAEECMKVTPFVDAEGHNQVALEYGPMADRLLKVMYQTVLNLAETGFDLVFDDVFWNLAEPAEILKEVEVILVNVYAPLDVLEKREIIRADRLPGMARWQYSKIYTPDRIFDIEIDTSKMSIDESVKTIQDFIQSGKKPTAFEKIRRGN